MRLFIYELVSAGGLGADTSLSLRREGWAMLSALVEDFMHIDGIEVATLLDTGAKRDLGHSCRRTSGAAERDAFREEARAADRTLVVAPEFDDLLASRSALAAGRLLGCEAAGVRQVSDKLNLHAVLCAKAVRTIPILACVRPGDPGPDARAVSYPLVCKPRFGAGCLGVQRIDGPDQLAGAVATARCAATADLLLQPLLPGLAASAAFVVGVGEVMPLLAGRQAIMGLGPGEKGPVIYVGGELPLPAALQARALRLAGRALGCFSGLRGYVGVDLILGSADDGSADYVVEINPRVTTAYVGLRRLCLDNLAELWWRAARGEPVRKPRWKTDSLLFFADGTIES